MSGPSSLPFAQGVDDQPNQSRLVGDGEPPGDLHAAIDDLARSKGGTAHALAQRLALEQL